MATRAQALLFINKIAPCAQKAYKELGKVKPSVCIAMACTESAYGTAGSCKYNSFLGHKVGSGKTATKYWDGTFKTWRTKEEYKIGVHTVITDAFRTYSSMEQCVFNFYELMNSKVYSRVKAESDYKTQMQQIKTCGYMTSSKEVATVISIIQKYNLTQYDSFSLGNSESAFPRYEIGKVYTLQNNMYIRERPGGDYIKDATDDAKKHMSVFPILNKGTRVTCKDIMIYKNATWLKIPSGWVCGIGSAGKVYIK
jgi:hypothetical protein